MPEILPPIGAVHTGCLHCGSRPETMPLDSYPHPGFGQLALRRDGETPDWWNEFCEVHCWAYYIEEGWRTGTRPDGSTYEWFDGMELIEWAVQGVQLSEIEECAAEDPDHDWRLEVHGPMYGVIYQRHGEGRWCAVERLEGFA